MSNDLTVKLSPQTRGLAEERTAQEGYSSVEDYVDALILEDNLDEVLRQPWIRDKLEEGMKSGSAGLLTRERLRQLVDEGIALTERERR